VEDRNRRQRSYIDRSSIFGEKKESSMDSYELYFWKDWWGYRGSRKVDPARNIYQAYMAFVQ
jgi:hypothetical protein